MKVVIIAGVVMTFAFQLLAGTRSLSYEDYKNSISSIDEKVGLMVSFDQLYGITNFVAIYEHPEDTLTNAMKYMGEATNLDSAKMIVVLSLQRLPLKSYLAFERKMLELSRQNLMSARLLNRALFPGLEWSTKIQCSYSQSEVQSFLHELLKENVVSDTNRTYVAEILSGQVCKDIRDLQEAGMLPKHHD